MPVQNFLPRRRKGAKKTKDNPPPGKKGVGQEGKR
jgi:hypothetical protein